jgi:hypothetical protein
MNIGGFRNRQVPSLVFLSLPPPFALTTKSLVHTLPPLPPCSPGRQCRLLARPDASLLARLLVPPLAQPTASLATSRLAPDHRRPAAIAGGPTPPPPSAIVGTAALRVASSSSASRSAPPRSVPTARPPAPRGPPPVRRLRHHHELRWGLNPHKFCILNKKFEC